MSSNKTTKTPAGVTTGSNKNTKTNTVSKTFSETLQLFDQMRKLGVFTKDELKSFLTRVGNLQIRALSKATGVSENRGVLPVLQAGRPLVSGDRHPDFAEWVPADEIGKTYGLTSGQVTKFTGKVRERFENEILANSEIRTLVESQGFPQPDRYGYLTYSNKQGTCVAIWSARSDGGVNWRNYWSPEGAQAIHQEIQKEGFTPISLSQQNGTQTPATA